MLAVINLVALLLICFWCWKRDQGVLRKFYWPALIVKCAAGISLGIIYSTYYDSSDTFTFFQWAAEKADLARNDFPAYLDFLFIPNEGYYLGEHRTIFYIRITSLLAIISGNNYWAISLWYSLLSFFAAWYLSNTIARLFPAYKIAACIAFLFFPSAVFWSSGVIKESLALAALFFLASIFIRLWMNEKISAWMVLLSVIALIIVFKLKYYYLAVFVPVTLSSLLVKRVSNRLAIHRPGLQILCWAIVLIGGFAAVSFLHPNFSSGKILSVIVSNNKIFMDACTPDDVIHFHNLQPNWTSILLNTPWALVSGLYRPFVWEANSVFKFITGVEHLVLMALTLTALPLLKRVKQSPHILLVLSAILYCALLSIFLALSTPNFGTLARFAVGFQPFLVLLVFNQRFVTKLLSRLF